jgi:hypothetical protein
MIELNDNQCKSINGAILPLIGALVTVFVLPKVINDHRKEYNQWGRNLGESIYEFNHPYDPNK